MYIPRENNVCYDLYNIDVFDNLLMNVAKYVEQKVIRSTVKATNTVNPMYRALKNKQYIHSDFR